MSQYARTEEAQLQRFTGDVIRDEGPAGERRTRFEFLPLAGRRVIHPLSGVRSDLLVPSSGRDAQSCLLMQFGSCRAGGLSSSESLRLLHSDCLNRPPSSVDG
jgi:hypothetical protein